MGRGTDVIPDRVKAQLLALGIPAAKHGAEGLAGLFPRELNVSAAGLSTEDLARVLIDLTGRGIIPVSGIQLGSSVKSVQPGWHFCQFYRDFKQLLAIVAPYIAEGLRNGEGCFWVMPEPVTRRAARDVLAQSLPNVDEYLASGQLEMMSHPEWYLDPSSRKLKTFDEIAGGLMRKQDQALAKGFKFVRAAGDTGWVSGTDESRDFIEYEMKVNAALRATKVAAICTYRADVTTDELVAIVTAHQDAVYKAPAC